MGTPLKSLSALLSPRLLTPKTPKLLLEVPKSGSRFLNVNSPQNVSRNHTKVSKKLFPTTTTTQDFLINTPNKLDLLKKGTENKILNILGKGSFGTVFKAKLNEKNENVAAKIVDIKSLQSERNALKLKHENIVKVLEIVENENYTKNAIIIMEYLKDTRDLQYFLNNETNISYENIIKISINVSKGVEYCHKNNILHLDLKPKNILVSGDICKICDFGNSMHISEVDSNFKHKGTIAYTAPEILLGKLPTFKCDIYSLGIIFWQLKYQRNPYENIDNNETIIYQVVKCNLRPNFEKTGDNFEKLYIQCWNYIENARPDAKYVVETLEKL